KVIVIPIDGIDDAYAKWYRVSKFAEVDALNIQLAYIAHVSLCFKHRIGFNESPAQIFHFFQIVVCSFPVGKLTTCIAQRICITVTEQIPVMNRQWCIPAIFFKILLETLTNWIEF